MPGESQQAPSSEPDPSVLTTDQLLRAVRAERDYVDGRMLEILERLRGIDRATSLLNETVNRTPTDIQKEVAHLRELTTVELSSIALQFKERDTRSERESRDNKVAVDAAFAAQKEAAAKQDEANQKAIDKSEKATSETINKNAELFATQQTGLSKEMTDLKARVDRMEANRMGAQESHSALYALLGLILTLIAVGITVAAFAASH